MLSCNTWKIQSLFMLLHLMLFKQYCLLVIYNCCINLLYCYTNNVMTSWTTSTAEEISPCWFSLKLHVPVNIFQFYHTQGGFTPGLLLLIFWTLKYSSFKQQKGRKSYKLTCLWVRTDVQTFGVCLQQRSLKATWNLTLRRSINFDCP